MAPNFWKRLGLSFLGGLFGSLLALMIFWGSYYVPFWYFPPIEVESPKVNYQMEMLSPEFEILWSSSADPSYYYDRNSGSIHFTGAEEGFFFLGGLNQAKYGRLSLVNLDPMTGEVKWRLFERPVLGKGPASTIAANTRFLYVGFEGDERTSRSTSWAAANIVAYDLNSREIVWSREIEGRKIDTLVASESGVSVETFFPYLHYSFDSETGEMLAARGKGDENFVWFVHDDIQYERGKNASIQAVDFDSGEILWQIESDFYVSLPPILENNIIVGRSGQTGFLGTVFGVDTTNGLTLWEYPDIIGNVAVDKGIAYFLTRHVQLWAVNIETGERLGTVSFSPDFHPDSPNHPYHVAASDGIVVVYLGEGQQMFGFRFLPST